MRIIALSWFLFHNSVLFQEALSFSTSSTSTFSSSSTYSSSSRSSRSTRLFASSTPAGFGSTSSSSSPASGGDKVRKEKIAALEQWAQSVGIKSKGIKVETGSKIIGGGLGLLSTSNLSPNSLLLQVPNHLTFSTSTSALESNPTTEQYFTDNSKAKAYRDAPWYAKLALDLYVCETTTSTNRPIDPSKPDNGETINMKPWFDSLPQSFDTPIHWTKDEFDMLQYQPLVSMVSAQQKSYTKIYNSLVNDLKPSSVIQQKWTYEDFLWGCDCARSRAFSGAYSGSAFDPKPYALTLLLVAAYVGLNLGSIEQASNGAALVFCGSILRDFVFPKLFKSKKYVICPYIDMANHVGMKEEGNVAFEYFGDGYSLASRSDTDIDASKEIRISYGPRSNDALLQQYGFVEWDNPHDVYVMPPLREWDIAALEETCGRTFQPGRLGKLERAGLLGGSSLGSSSSADDDDGEFVEGVANRGRGVVITRAGGVDPAIFTALRTLVSSAEEWSAVGEAVGNLVTENSGGEENERLARLAAQKALELELESKETTLEEDEELWKKMCAGNSGNWSNGDRLAVQFRMEKKKLLKETIFALSL